MDILARLAFKLRRLMAELPADSAHFDFGRLFADAGRVFVRAWVPIALGVAVLGIAPVVVSAMPWWRGSPDTTAVAYRRIWTAVNLAKALVVVTAESATTVVVAAISVSVLTGKVWREMFEAPRIAVGFVTALCVGLAGNWATFVATAAAPLAPPYQALLLLGIAGRLSLVALAAYFGIAASAALVEQRLPGAAFARSFRLLRGLRWRMVGVALGYLFSQGLVQYGVALALSLARMSYRTPGPGRAVLSLATLPVGAVATAVFVSFFLQARRITDGPTASELHDVFG
jgi:hypothetical protein